MIQDETVKNLRIENEYFQKQLDTLRRDAENAKMREKEAREAFERESFAREALEKGQMQSNNQRVSSMERGRDLYNMTVSNSYEP